MKSNFGKNRVTAMPQPAARAWPQVERRRRSRGPASGPSPVRIEAQARNLFDGLRSQRIAMMVLGIAVFACLIFVTAHRG